MWIEVLVTIIGFLSISELLFGGIADGIGNLVDAFLNRRRPRDPLLANPQRTSVSDAAFTLLQAVFGALLGFTSLLVWPNRLGGSSLAARAALLCATVIACGILTVSIDSWRRPRGRGALRFYPFAHGAVFALLFAIARAIGHASRP